MLPRDAYDRIKPLDKSFGTDGSLAKRLAAFLISRLPTETGADIGVRATPDHLADLLVDDLTIDQGAFRSRVRTLVHRMVEDGHLVPSGDAASPMRCCIIPTAAAKGDQAVVATL